MITWHRVAEYKNPLHLDVADRYGDAKDGYLWCKLTYAIDEDFSPNNIKHIKHNCTGVDVLLHVPMCTWITTKFMGYKLIHMSINWLFYCDVTDQSPYWVRNWQDGKLSYQSTTNLFHAEMSHWTLPCIVIYPAFMGDSKSDPYYPPGILCNATSLIKIND